MSDKYPFRERPKHIKPEDWCVAHSSWRKGRSCYETWGDPYATGRCVFGNPEGEQQ